MLTVTYNAVSATLSGDVPPKVLDELHAALAYKLEGTDQAKAVFYASRGRINAMFRYWDGWHRLFNKKTRQFPTGLLATVQTLLDSHRLTVELKPEQPAPKPRGRLVSAQLRDYQIDTVQALLACERATAEAPTGSGKSRIIAELTQQYPELSILVLVPSLYLLHQLRQDLADATGEAVGIWGDSQYEPGRVVVATVQTASKGLPDPKKSKQATADAERVDRLKAFRYVIYDEAHLVGCDQHRILAHYLSGATLRHGVSATLRREDGAETLLEGIIGPRVHTVPITPLIESGILSDVLIELHEFEHADTDLNWKETKDTVLKALDRTRFGLGLLQRELAAGYDRCLILYQFEEHGKQILEELQAFCPKSRLIDGKASAKKREAAIQALESGEITVLVASTILDVGVNIPCVQLLLPLGAGKGVNVLMQRVGRILRPFPGKPRARVLDIFDRHNKYLEEHAKKRLTTYCLVYGPQRVTLVTSRGTRETLAI